MIKHVSSNSKVREIFLLLGASEDRVDKLVTIYQTRHIQPLPVEDRVEYFNFLGVEDALERITHAVRGHDICLAVDFLYTQSPKNLIYKRFLDKICHFIFAPDWLEKLGEMWHAHSFHTHDPREEWNKVLDYASKKDETGRLAEDLISQLFNMNENSPAMLDVKKSYSGNKKIFSSGVWRPLNLQEKYALSKSASIAVDEWLQEDGAISKEIILHAKISEFGAFIKKIKTTTRSVKDIRKIFELIHRFEETYRINIPELTTSVRRYYFEKLVEPYNRKEPVKYIV